MSKFAQHVKILVDDEHSLSWVTSYEVCIRVFFIHIYYPDISSAIFSCRYTIATQ